MDLTIRDNDGFLALGILLIVACVLAVCQTACWDREVEGPALDEACGGYFDMDKDGRADSPPRAPCEGTLEGWAPGDLPYARTETRMTDVNGDEHVTVTCELYWSGGTFSYSEAGEDWEQPQLSRMLIDGEPHGEQDGLWDWELDVFYPGTCE